MLQWLGPWLAMAALHCNEYPLEPTKCDDFCAAKQRLHCAEDEPVTCVRTCEVERAVSASLDGTDPCESQRAALLECQRSAPESSFTCQHDETTPAPGLCRQEQTALRTCQTPVTTAEEMVCQTWLAACSSMPDGDPLYPGDGPQPTFACGLVPIEEACREEQLAWYGCLLAGPPECDSRPPKASRCADEQAALSACDMRFAGSVCVPWAWSCAGLGATHARIRPYVDACLSLSPKGATREACADPYDEFLACMQTHLNDCAGLSSACATERAALEACSISAPDADASD
jgi:hypothetical protein